MNMSIKSKLILPLIIATALCVIMIAIGHSLFNKMEKTEEALGQAFLPAVSKVLNADRDLYQARLAQLEFLNTQDSKQKNTARNDFDENNQQALDRFKSYMTLMAKENFDKQKLQSFDSVFKNWKNSAQLFFDNPSIVTYEQSNNSFEALRDVYDSAGELAVVQAETMRTDTQTTTQRWFMALLSVSALTIGYFIFVIFKLPATIISPIKQLRATVHQLNSGNGDLSQRLPEDRKDELGELAASFNELLSSLETMFHSIFKSTQAMNSDLNDFYKEVEEVGEATQKQSSAVSNLATSQSQSNQATCQIAEITSQTANHTQSALTEISDGRESIQEYSEDIRQMSKELSDNYELADSLKKNSASIVTVMVTIRSIAEQTNLLALNAAIEAARAGEQGRGFAVVADEVRTLASRTQDSTSEIDQIVGGFQTNVEEVFKALAKSSEKLSSTSDLSQNTIEGFKNVEKTVSEINGLSLQTATASEEQTYVSNEINDNVKIIASEAEENSRRIVNVKQMLGSFNSRSNQLVEAIQKYVHN